MAPSPTDPPHPPIVVSRLRVLVAVLTLVLAVAAVFVFAGDRLADRAAGGGDADEEPFPVQPPGFWSTAAAPAVRATESGTDDGASPEERARLVSLPYLGGRMPAGEAYGRGVVRHLPERAWEGVNLYNSGHGPEAILIDMEGRPLHRWRYPFERAFPEVRPTPDTPFFRRVHLFPDGRLLALYQTGGLVFLDRDSRPLGTCAGNFYNDLWVEEDAVDGGGRIWALAKEVRGTSAEARLDDFAVLLRYRGDGTDCREERRISLTDAFARSRFAGLLHPLAPRGDVLHSNTITELPGTVRGTGGWPDGFAPGRLLVSLREVDLVAVVDPDSETVTWARSGPWRAQHEPSLLDSGRLLLFDNRGDDGHSRLLEVDPATGEVVWSWSGEPPRSFASAIGGSCSRLPNGNTLATLSVPGRALEIDPAGEVVWEFRTPHRAGPDDGLVAMLFELQRLPRDRVEGWLE